MAHTDQNNQALNHFYGKYSAFTDQQIIGILKNRKNYQDAAVTVAVRIAIERGLINTEQDLMAPEYQPETSKGFQLFPRITDDYHSKRVKSSLFRLIYIITVVPLIAGILSYSKGEQTMMYAGFSIAFCWLILVGAFHRTGFLVFFGLLLGLVLSVSIWLILLVFSREILNYTDLVILVSGTLLLLYLLIYARQLRNS